MAKRTMMVFLVLLWAAPVFGAHPLITDDTGTQGKGKFQFEMSGQAGFDKIETTDETGAATTTKSREWEFKTALGYGIGDTLDIVVGMPYQWKRIEVNDVLDAETDGVSDLSLEVKWRFFEKEGLSFALKPGITLPTGDKDKDLGTGRVTGSVFFITTIEREPFMAHLNLGYKRNENKLDQREDIWHASLAGEYRIVKPLRFVANVGTETNTDRSSQIWPAFILGGFIYSLTQSLDLDLGIKGGLNDAEKDVVFLGGISLRF